MLRALIIAVIAGLLVGPLVLASRYARPCCPSKVGIAKLAVGQLAHDHYPRWALAHEGSGCPTLLDVAQHAGKTEEDLRDPWGRTYELTCSASMQVEIRSSGEDRAMGTVDDITSWDR